MSGGFLRNLAGFRSYQMAMELYRACDCLRAKGVLKHQLDRASLGVVLNLSEGSGKFTPSERRRFYRIAFGSLRETQTLLELAKAPNETRLLAETVSPSPSLSGIPHPPMMDLDSKPFSLRPASVDDLDSILEIEKKAYPMPWTRPAFEEELNKSFSHFLVLTDDETDSVRAAYIVYWLLFDEAHVLNVTVAPEWRGLEVGTRLLRHVMGEAVKKEMKRVFLEVRKSNEAAVRLYQKLGFYIDHVKKRFYEDGEDAYFMIRYLEKNPTKIIAH